MEIIDLQNENKVIPYKDYIRKIVYAHTVYFRDSYDTRFRAVEIFRKLPVKNKKSISWGSIFICFLLGMATGIYIFII